MPRKIIEEVLEENIILIISDEQFKEICRVLDYPKLGFTGEQKYKLREFIMDIAILVSPIVKDISN